MQKTSRSLQKKTHSQSPTPVARKTRHKRSHGQHPVGIASQGHLLRVGDGVCLPGDVHHRRQGTGRPSRGCVPLRGWTFWAGWGDPSAPGSSTSRQRRPDRHRQQRLAGLRRLPRPPHRPHNRRGREHNGTGAQRDGSTARHVICKMCSGWHGGRLRHTVKVGVAPQRRTQGAPTRRPTIQLHGNTRKMMVSACNSRNPGAHLRMAHHVEKYLRKLVAQGKMKCAGVCERKKTASCQKRAPGDRWVVGTGGGTGPEA